MNLFKIIKIWYFLILGLSFELLKSNFSPQELKIKNGDGEKGIVTDERHKEQISSRKLPQKRTFSEREDEDDESQVSKQAKISEKRFLDIEKLIDIKLLDLDESLESKTKEEFTEDYKEFKKTLKEKIEWLTVFNVGQGNGILFETENHLWIVDFGSTGSPTEFNNDGKYEKERFIDNAHKIVSEIIEAGKKKIIIMVTHPDSDHYNAIHYLFTKENCDGAVKYWIYTDVYDEACFGNEADHFELLGINKKGIRVKITERFIFSQDPDQDIVFINNPNFPSKDVKSGTCINKNENSMILRVKVGDTTVLLTGDATIDTYELQMTFIERIKRGSELIELIEEKEKNKLDVEDQVLDSPLDLDGDKDEISVNKEPKDSSYGLDEKPKELEMDVEFDSTTDEEYDCEAEWKDYFGNNDPKRYEEFWKSIDPNLLDILEMKTTDYLVAPHHGSCTHGSSSIIGKTNPTKGIIFSAPVGSKHNHPTLAAIHTTAKGFKKNGVKELTDEKLIYFDATKTPTDFEMFGGKLDNYLKAQKKDELKILGINLQWKFFNHIKPESKPVKGTDLFKFKTVLSSLNNLKVDKTFLAKTKWPIYITGLDGDISLTPKKDFPKEVELKVSFPFIKKDEAKEEFQNALKTKISTIFLKLESYDQYTENKEPFKSHSKALFDFANGLIENIA